MPRSRGASELWEIALIIGCVGSVVVCPMVKLNAAATAIAQNDIGSLASCISYYFLFPNSEGDGL